MPGMALAKIEMPLPIWVIALVLAALAPLVARGLAMMFERRARERSARVLAGIRPSGDGGREREALKKADDDEDR